MRVLHLLDGYPPADGCAGRWCQGLSRALVRRGVAVQVLSVASRADGSELAWGRADIDEGVRVERAVASAPASQPRWRETHGTKGPASSGEPRLAAGAKVGRNDPCPCGSGKKYKKCCLLKGA